MRQSDDYYLRAIAALLAGKWTLPILTELRGGTKRFNEIQRGVPDSRQKVLTETLKKLERDGMITRQAYPTIPPQVEYTITPFGSELLKMSAVFTEWAEQNIETLKHARKAYDHRVD